MIYSSLPVLIPEPRPASSLLEETPWLEVLLYDFK
jgi:hypothetical protein